MAVALSSATLFPSRLGVQRNSTDQTVLAHVLSKGREGTKGKNGVCGACHLTDEEREPHWAQTQTSTRVISTPSPNAIVFNLNRCSRGVNFSRRRNGVVASAASGSPGIESSSSNAEDTASLLDTVKVFDLNGNGIPISDLWKDRTAVIAFARHFGCVFCRKRADYLASKKDIMDKSGVALVLIGPGSINQAKSFSEQTRFQGEVYADPSHSSYEALRFVSGVTTTFTPKAGLKIIQLYMEGYRQDWKLSFEQDTVSRGGWQQGGIIVAGPGKSNILYIHKDKEAGDDPDIKDILNACCGA